MSIFTSPSPETVGLTSMVAVLLAILLLIISGSIWDHIRRRRARDWDLTSFSEQEKGEAEITDGAVIELGRDWEDGRGDAVRQMRAHVWDLERMGADGGGAQIGGAASMKGARSGQIAGNGRDCLGRAVAYVAEDCVLQRHEAEIKHQDQFSNAPMIPERVSSLPPPRAQQQRGQRDLLSTPPTAHLARDISFAPRFGTTAAGSTPRPVQKLLPQLPPPQTPKTPSHPHPIDHQSRHHNRPLPLTPWVRALLPSPPASAASKELGREPELTYPSSSPPTSSTLPSSSPPAAVIPPYQKSQPRPQQQHERPARGGRAPASLDLNSWDGSVAGRGSGSGNTRMLTRMRDPSDSSPTYYFLPLLSPAVFGESGSHDVAREDGKGGMQGEEGGRQDEESLTLPPVTVVTPIRKTKVQKQRARRSTAASSATTTVTTRQTQLQPTTPSPTSRSHTHTHAHTHANNPLPPLPLHIAPAPPTFTTIFAPLAPHPLSKISQAPGPAPSPSPSSALSTHLAASCTWGRGAGRSDGNGRFGVPRKPLAVRKDTAYLDNISGGNVMTLKGLALSTKQRERQKMDSTEKDKETKAEHKGRRTPLRDGDGDEDEDEDVGRDVEMDNEQEKENRRPSDITETEMSLDGEGGEDVTPEYEDGAGNVGSYVGFAGGAGVRYPKVPRESAMVWSRARGATWD